MTTPSEDDFARVRDAICDAHRIPPAMLGRAPEMRTVRQRGEVKIAYLRAFGVDPWLSDDPDVLHVLRADHLRQLGLR